jgi:hypothetical protein
MRRCRWLALLMPLLVLAGCSRQKPQAVDDGPDEAAPAQQKPAAPARPAVKPVGEAEARQFAQSLEAAAGKADEARKLLDGEALLVRAFGEGKIPAAARPSAKNPDLAEQLAGTVGTGGSYRLVRVHDKGGEWKALFRLVDVSGNVNYHDLILARRDGVVKAVDAVLIAAGESLSALMRSAYLSELPADALSEHERELLKHRDTLAAMRGARTTGNASQALRLFVALPVGVQREKSVQIQRLLAAATAEANAFRLAVDEFEKLYPDDSCFDLMACNAYLMRKQYGNALEAVDRLDKALGGDAYLDVLRATIKAEQGELLQARETAARVMKAYPDLASSHLLRLSLSLREKDFATTAEELTALRQTFGIDVGDVSANPTYAEFVSSSEGKAWTRRKQ